MQAINPIGSHVSAAPQNNEIVLQQLYRATKEGDVDTVTRLLQQHPVGDAINEYVPGKALCLAHYALRSTHSAIITALRDHPDIDPNGCDL